MTWEQRCWLFASAVLVVVLVGCSYVYWDQPLARWGKELKQTHGWWIHFMGELGHGKWWIPLGLVLAVACRFGPGVVRSLRLSRAGFFIFSGILVSGLIVNVIKVITARYRPRVFFEDESYGFTFFAMESARGSFPSGHTSNIVIVAATLCFVLPRYAWVWIPMAGVIGFFRVLQTAHFLGDVIAAAYVATLTALMLRHLYRRWGIAPEPWGRATAAPPPPADAPSSS